MKERCEARTWRSSLRQRCNRYVHKLGTTTRDLENVFPEHPNCIAMFSWAGKDSKLLYSGNLVKVCSAHFSSLQLKEVQL